MADEKQLRSPSTFADLLSPAQVNSIVAGAVHDHDEPVEGEAEKGHAGQDGSNAEAQYADDESLLPMNSSSLGIASESSVAGSNLTEQLNVGETRTRTGGLTAASADLLQGQAGRREHLRVPKPQARPAPARTQVQYADALTKAAQLNVLTTLSQLMQGQAPMPAAAALYK